MARKKKVVQASSPSSAKSAASEKVATPPVPSSPDARTTKPVDEVIGVPPLVLSPEVRSPTASTQGKSSWSAVVRSSDDNLLCDDFESLNVTENGNVKITVDDIVEEVEYWQASIISHVLGSNPPVQVMSNFFKKIWSDLLIDKIAALGKGYYIIKFANIDDRNAALEKGTPFFDRKPVILRPGSADFDINSVNEVKVPVWVRIPGLPLKYWGRKALPKIASSLGKPIRIDRATAAKERLSFARILVEMDIQKTFPGEARFENENGKLTEMAVSYEWKPIQCSYCTLFGHDLEHCKKKENEKKSCDYCNMVGHSKEECRRKGKQPAKKEAANLPGKDASKPTGKPIPNQKLETQNQFVVLQDDQEQAEGSGAAEKDGQVQTDRNPPPDMSDFPPLPSNG